MNIARFPGGVGNGFTTFLSFSFVTLETSTLKHSHFWYFKGTKGVLLFVDNTSILLLLECTEL